METKKKDITFKENKNKTHSLILQHYNLELKGGLKGMDNYDSIETYQGRIELSKLIHSVCNLQNDNK